MRADQLPEEIHEAIRRWSEDYTNVEPWRGKNYPGENLVQYLYWAGWRIEPTPKTRREIQDRARSLRQDKVAVARSYGGHTAEQWQAMLKWAGHMCVKCSVPFGEGEPATKDHVIPLVNGGDDSIHNIQPLCLSCNSTKRTATTDHRNPGWWEAVL